MNLAASRGARGFLRVFFGLLLLGGATAAQAQPTVPGGLSLTRVTGAASPTLSFTWDASTGGTGRTDYVVQLRELPAAFPTPSDPYHANAWPDYATVTSGLTIEDGIRFLFPDEDAGKTERWVVFANLQLGETYEVRILSEDNTLSQSAWSETVQIDVCPCSLSFASAQDEVRMHGGAPAPVTTLPAARHGTSPYSYGLTALPAGLAFNKDTRAISGTPAAVSSVTTANMTYTVTDSDSATTFQNFDIQVAPALTFASAPPAEFAFGRNIAVSKTLPEIGGGFTPYAYSLEGGALPGGLTFTAATRILSGMSSALADATFTYTAKDALGAAGTASGVITSDIRIRVVDFDLDVDNSGAITAQDGIMIARHLLGAEAASVTANQSGTAAATVAGNIQDGVDLGLLDVDADNDTDGNDGIMVARYILGLRGDELIAGMGDAVAATVEGKMGALTP